MKPAELDLRDLQRRVHSLPLDATSTGDKYDRIIDVPERAYGKDGKRVWGKGWKPIYAIPPKPKTWRMVGTVLFFILWGIIAFTLGSFNQASYELIRWQQVREQLLNPPKGQKPPERTIPELGIRLTWLDWSKTAPDSHVAIEDVR